MRYTPALIFGTWAVVAALFGLDAGGSAASALGIMVVIIVLVQIRESVRGLTRSLGGR